MIGRSSLTCLTLLWSSIGAILGWAGAARAEAAFLSQPVDCAIGRTCFVQNFFDIDRGPGVRDWRCGTASYDGHTGVDIRLLSAAATDPGVAVRAAAPGTVRTIRDGLTESLLTGAARAALMAQGLGNVVVLDHANGYQTIYGHMKPGSVRVRPGEPVARGATLGEVGFTGLAAFAHLHFEVRRDGRAIDPYLGRPAGAAACAATGPGEGQLWTAEAAAVLAYRGGEVAQIGFAGAPVAHDRLEHDHQAVEPPGPDKEVLVLYARMLNLAAGDRLRLTISGPEGIATENTGPPIDRSKATFTAFIGRRRPASGWPAGTYTGVVEIMRGAAVIRHETARLNLP